MLKNTIRLARISTILFLAASIFAGCNDEPSAIGLELLPEGDIIKAEAIIEYPEFMNVKNRVRTDNFIGTEAISSSGSIGKWFKSYYGILGHFDDPRFGFTSADIVTEVSLFSGREAFIERLGADSSAIFEVDSIKLLIAYAPMANDASFSWIGDSSAEHTIKVYELSQRISNVLSGTDKYYNDASIEGMYYPEALAELSWKTNNITTNSTNDTNLINITLSQEFAQKIFNLSSDDLKDKNSFKDAFHGFYITVNGPLSTEEGAKALIKLDLLSPYSRLVMYYHKNLIDADTDELIATIDYNQNFPINVDATMYNRYNHEHGDKIEFETTSTPYLFIQNMAGSYVNFNFGELAKNALDAIKNSDYKYGISSVELVFEGTPANADELNLYLPQLNDLVILEKNDNGQLVIPKFDNDGDEQTAFFNNGLASYVTQTDTLNEDRTIYSFKMNPDYFLKLAEEETTPSFYIRGANPAGGEQINPEFNFNRTVLYNTADAERRPKFIVKYVRYN